MDKGLGYRLNPFGFRAGFRTDEEDHIPAHECLNPFGFRAGFRTPTEPNHAPNLPVLIPLVSGLGSGL